MIEEIVLFSALAIDLMLIIALVFISYIWSKEAHMWEEKLEHINNTWYRKYCDLIKEFEEYMKENERGNK